MIDKNDGSLVSSLGTTGPFSPVRLSSPVLGTRSQFKLSVRLERITLQCVSYYLPLAPVYGIIINNPLARLPRLPHGPITHI